ncbi:hypothetical protein ASPZODRAFT_19699 [Penicilliopsis zonata CBS 506.65]|uniref:JmjC domain-containing histone demethylation protein 1 n=1 Tax=Penicilliopsis zonata CBS 506.65 TaxID=1073090 RepID=A0A1L9S808_9EURO|nr:hypothetical protein ASPZODRAFT_19699 [Penicilliopsis zonata CBS 506.65]OJJ43296.1 hypothetical protein ASPZODRAFT_19699 [Penicilliopsis zonata CBS 506.65]
MASATSFLSHRGSRPPRYRTPSPPRRAVEPISPVFTTGLRATWAERAAPTELSSDCDPFSSNGNRTSDTSREAHHHRPGHGRSSSTIDTLATIALATSPTFSPLTYRPPSQNSSSTIPLFASDHNQESGERPAKRPRSEKDPSPPHDRREAGLDSRSSALLDSMKTDAELLLNFARPTNFLPVAPSTKQVSIDDSYAIEGDSKPHARADSAEVGGYPKIGEENFAQSFHGNNIPLSRMRSRSDGSTIVARPVIHGIRPSTSSSHLPPIVWQDEPAEPEWVEHPPAITQRERASSSSQNHEPNGSLAASITVKLPPKAEEETDSDNSSQASCAACNLVRIPVGSEEQGEVTWINCDGCKRWYHIVCAGFKNDREVRTVDKFICRGCRPLHGSTTFVRKSSRARTAIDYAGLNQGLVKAATDPLEHHYIEPIKQGKIRFLPENFPRMRPELINAEYFERGNGMTEPIVIPASLNTRHAVPPTDPDFDTLVQEASTQEMFDELLDHLHEVQPDLEEVIDCGQDQLDMVIPQGLTVRAVAELYGPEERVEVIDVKSQQGEDKRWNMQKWADYYESTGVKVVRNVISLEVSQSKLGRLIRRPKIVRDLDLQDSVWPTELKAIGDHPKVQFYCLMSVADCYTDFHIDFGGSSVYYHILKGKKTFFFIPPKDKHLKKYEEWCNSPAQDTTFLGDQTKECYRVDLDEGDTMLIPSGWIHAVWTPENSLVIGGNFLTRLNYGMQIKVAKIEKDTKVPRKFRYPFFQKIQWYTALKYLEDDPIPQSVLDAFAQDEAYRFHRRYPIYYEFGERANAEAPGSPYHNSRYYSQAELEGLPDLAKYLLRTALIAGSYMVEGVTMEQRTAIKRSIPKGQGDPVDAIRKFGIWVAWKRGNEQAPSWTRPGVIESNAKISFSEKKPAGRPSRRSERNADNQRMYTERQAVQRPPEASVDSATSVSSTSYGESSLPSDNISTPASGKIISNTSSVKDEPSKPRSVPRGSGLGPKRVACDACRKRRIRCRHKDETGDVMFAKQMAVGNFSPGFGIPNQASLAHDAASALSSLAAIASEAGFQDTGAFVGLDHFEASGQPSSALLNSPTMATNGLVDLSPDGAASGKKGRSKACDDCRKSKRRCIHDEYGRVDPVKAQERSKPRASTSAKRARTSEDGLSFATATHKRPKQESASPVTRAAELLGRDDDAPGGALSSGHHNHEEHAPFQPAVVADPWKAPVVEVDNDVSLVHQMSYASPPAFQTDAMVHKELGAVSMPSQPPTSLVSPPTSLADEIDEVPRESADRDMRTLGEGGPLGLLSRAAEHHHAPESVARTARPAEHAPTRKPPSPTAKKPSSRPSSSHTKKSASPMTSPAHSNKSAKRERLATVGDDELDPESMRLIREIQEQEFGLRKRATRV